MKGEIKWITDQKPKTLKPVLLRDHQSEPLWIGWIDFNGKWKSCGGGTMPSVSGWMHLEDAAAVLDNQTPVPK